MNYLNITLIINNSMRSSFTIKEAAVTYSFDRFGDSSMADVAMDLKNSGINFITTKFTGLQVFKECRCNNTAPDIYCDYFYEFDIDSQTVEVFGYSQSIYSSSAPHVKDKSKKLFSGTIREFIEKYAFGGF